MEGELNNFIKVWILAISSLCYCYYISAKFPKGFLRLLSLLPVIYLFFILPLSLSTVHFCGITAFFLTWLANFKLLLFSFDQPPLSPLPPKLSHFISIACLPIKLKEDSPLNTERSNLVKTQCPQKPRIYGRILLAIKVLLLALVFHLYEYRQSLPKSLVRTLYGLHLYVELEIALALVAAPSKVLLSNFVLEPQFNEPYLATSLQDFWGRRWNLMVTRLLRPAVYNPMRRLFIHIMGSNSSSSKWASLQAVLAVFVVSGLVHELIFYYLTRMYPTWEVTWFFILHGICVAIEVAVKKVNVNARKNRRWQLHPAISTPLTMAFVVVTGFWLFFAPLVRYGIVEKVVKESLMSYKFVKEMVGSLQFLQVDMEIISAIIKGL